MLGTPKISSIRASQRHQLLPFMTVTDFDCQNNVRGRSRIVKVGHT